jgi:hypothetical protein
MGRAACLSILNSFFPYISNGLRFVGTPGEAACNFRSFEIAIEAGVIEHSDQVSEQWLQAGRKRADARFR